MKQNSGNIKINYIDIKNRCIFFAELKWQQGIIRDIKQLGQENTEYSYLLPGFVDAHVHIESSMLTPVEFSRLAVRHGTVATLSDPHEIANVLGLDGFYFMHDNAAQTPLKVFFGAPSCVPATPFETAGASLNVEQLESLFKTQKATYLSEMMNYPGVLTKDPDVMAKLELAQNYGLRIDGHAPNVCGKQASQYAQAGISTDHECSSLAEAQDKIAAGMQILIREGSAARNFEALHELITLYPDRVMFCSDDKHPDDLQLGHINQLVVRAITKGHNLYDVLQCACINPVKHYDIPVGQLGVGDAMDAVEVSDLQSFTPIHTWIDGLCVAKQNKNLILSVDTPVCNQFNARLVEADDFIIKASGDKIRVIKAFDGELLTQEWLTEAKTEKGMIVPDIKCDILLLTVVNRYQTTKPSIAFIHGFNLKAGALASTVAHDSHNIIAVATDIPSLCQAINSIINQQGGIAVVDAEQQTHLLPLPIAGLMSDDDGDKVACLYADLDQRAKQLGSTLRAPFMTLSFMALLVIPELKLSDKGLFDGRSFSFTSLTE
ncbi:MAG: adenine deaminase [Methylococcales bacterium]|nr:adenine deaminase [Methylococcales bacterium]